MQCTALYITMEGVNTVGRFSSLPVPYLREGVETTLGTYLGSMYQVLSNITSETWTWSGMENRETR